jgi:tRNA modification GTPase
VQKNPDTIVAIATAAGRGGVGIVRVSGPQAFEIGRKLFVPDAKESTKSLDRQAVYGQVVNPADGSGIDDGFLLAMAKPRTYTGEDVVEFQTHGSPIVLEKIVGLCKAHGARFAEPGEFTRRAFLNGRMDLLQAEAVAELIAAESEAEARVARARIDGDLSGPIEKLRAVTVEVLAELEADIDFPDENLELLARPPLLNKLSYIQEVTQNLLATYDANRRLQNGFCVVLVGQTNVGKSSLFNALLQMDRAIVTAIPGTTRDVLREELMLDGRRVRLVDTAGIHPSPGDEVERIGMKKTAAEASNADLVCLVCSAKDGFGKADMELLERFPNIERWLVWNKIDLGIAPKPPTGFSEVLNVSATRGDGVSDFRERLGKRVKEGTSVAAGIANVRQQGHLEEFQQAIEKGIDSAKKNVSPEFIAFEFRQAYRTLSRMIGRDEGIDAILDEIFSRFCIGK